MAANGAVTLGTALDATYSTGIWLYYPAGAVYSGSVAGFYWTVMSSTTVGTVYMNTYVPGTSTFDAPASPTAVVAAGPGAFTGVTAAVTMFSVPSIPLRVGGRIRHRGYIGFTNNANSKTSLFYVGNVTSSNGSSNTSIGYRFYDFDVVALPGGKFTTPAASSQGNGSGNGAYINAKDLTVVQTLSLTMQCATATDYAIYSAVLIEACP
jgi:hypothetical protein